MLNTYNPSSRLWPFDCDVRRTTNRFTAAEMSSIENCGPVIKNTTMRTRNEKKLEQVNRLDLHRVNLLFFFFFCNRYDESHLTLRYLFCDVIVLCEQKSIRTVGRSRVQRTRQAETNLERKMACLWREQQQKNHTSIAVSIDKVDNSEYRSANWLKCVM